MIPLSSKQNTVSPNSTYPYGAIKDNPGDGTGTPVNTQVYGDMHQFLEKLFANSGLTANGLPDNATNGFQLFEAFITSGNANFSADIITALKGSYTANDLLVLWGVNMTQNIGGTSSVTQGAIFYNNIIYKVATNSSISTPTGLGLYIDTSVQPNVIYLKDKAAAGAIANYGDSTIKYINLPNNFIDVSTEITSGSINTIEANILTLTPSSTQSCSKIRLDFYINFTASNSGDDIYFFTIYKNGVAIHSITVSTPLGYKISTGFFVKTSYAAGDVITVGAKTQNYITGTIPYAILNAQSSNCNF